MASQTTTRIEPQKLEDLLKFRRELSHNFMPTTAKEDEVFDSADKVFDFIYTKTSKLMDTSHLFIIFGNKVTSTHKLQIFNQSSKVKEKFNHHEELYSSFKEDKTKIRKLFASEKELYLETKSEVARFFALEPGEKEIFPTTLLCIKMLWKKMPIGMFIIYHPTQEHAYSEKRLNLLRELSGQVATYLYNRRLVQQRTALLEISKELTSAPQIEEDKILNLVYDQIRQLMHSHNMLVVLRDKQTGYLRPALVYKDGVKVSVVEEEQDQLYQYAKTVIENEVIQKRKTVFIRTKKRIETKFCFGKTLLENLPATWLAVPMRLGENEQPPMGAFVVYHPRLENAYGESDKDILKTMADRVAIALDNVYFNQKWEGLARMGVAFAKDIHLDENETLNLIHTETGKLIGNSNHFSMALRMGGQIQLVFEEGKLINDEEAHKKYHRYLKRPCRILIDKIFNEKKPILLETRSKITAKNAVAFKGKNVPASWLGVPMRLGEKVIGAFVISHPELEYAYNKTDEKALSVLSERAAIILDNAHKHAQILNENRRKDYLVQVSKEVFEKNRKLNALIQVAQELTSSIELPEQQILHVIHTQANKVMDTKNMYAALYDEQNDEVRFPLYFENNLSKNIPTRKMGQNIPTRKMGQGKTEEIIRTKKPIFHPTLAESKEWYAQPGRTNYVGKPLPSWIGVPMMYGDKVLGVIAVYHPTQEYIYGKDDLEILGALAGLAAIALENSRLYIKSTQQAKALENANQSLAQHQDIVTRASIANDFVHRIRNLVGTIPGWADMIKGEISRTEPRIEKIVSWSVKIRKDIENLHQSVDRLKEPEHEVEIDIVFILTNMLHQVRIQFRSQISAGQLEIKENACSTYKVFGLRSALSHAIHGIISNGIEAVLETQQAGVLEITISDYNNSDGEWVKIEVKDTGIGIAKEDFDKIFIPFASTKGRGRGYGLWRSKTVIENMDGNIEVSSSEGKGTVFNILLPKYIKVINNDC